MRIRCYGSRGSLPVSGPQFDRFGGDTTCMEIRSRRGDVIVIDAGTGIRSLGNKLIKANTEKIDMLFTHAHLDHIMGFSLFAPIFKKGVDVTIHGNSFLYPSYRDILSGIMRSPYFPVDLEAVNAQLSFHDCDSEQFTIGTITVQPILLSHPNGGLGFRFEEDGASFVFLTDNELSFTHPGGKSIDEYADFASRADLLIHDAEFTEKDYPANRSFGHSVYSDAVKLAVLAKVKRLGLFHMNRERTDAQVDKMEKSARAMLRKSKADIECFAVSNTFEITL